MLFAFIDDGDGYYQVEVPDGFPMPAWTLGLTPTQVLPPPPTLTPKSVTMRQARLALLQAGKLSAVNAAISAMQGTAGEAARIEWDYSNEVHRNQPLTIALAKAIGMTEEEMDTLFVEAAKL